MPHALNRSLRHPTRLGRGGRVVAVLALLALLLAQGWGLAHRVWHDPAHHTGAGGPQQVGHEDCDHEAGHGDGPAAAHPVAGGHGFALIDELVHGHDEGSAECRLLDQLAHADALTGGANLASAGSAPAAPDGAAPCPAAGRSSAAYQARAPPRRPAATPAAHTG